MTGANSKGCARTTPADGFFKPQKGSSAQITRGGEGTLPPVTDVGVDPASRQRKLGAIRFGNKQTRTAMNWRMKMKRNDSWLGEQGTI
jgi:hypothetical protein